MNSSSHSSSSSLPLADCRMQTVDWVIQVNHPARKLTPTVTLLSSAQLCSTLLGSVLFCSALFWSTLCCTALFFSALCCSVLLYSTLLSLTYITVLGKYRLTGYIPLRTQSTNLGLRLIVKIHYKILNQTRPCFQTDLVIPLRL